MNRTDDFDRVLAQWFEEGQTTAPEWPIERAIDHARRHPRRRDILAFIRPDAMPSRRSGLVLQPVGALLLLGLVLAAVVAVAVGSFGRGPVVVPPSLDPSTTPILSPSPDSSPTAPTEPTPSNEPDFSIQLDLAGGSTNDIRIFDRSGLVTTAASGTPNEGASFAPDTVEVTNDDPTTLRLGWSGGCEDIHALSIDPTGRLMTLERPRCAGDSVGFDRILLLTFGEPVAADDVTVELRDGVGELLPNWRQFTADAGGNLVTVDVHDISGSVEAVDQAQAEGSVAERDVLRVEALPGDDTTLVLTWSGPACETAYSLTVGEDVGQLDLVRQPCAASGDLFNRSIAVTLSQAVDTDSIATEITDGD
jgi:hypothetical protein